ncbi:MAG: hypothetical protein SNJ49_13575 [Chloracidobacterium sp.]
MTLGNWFGLPSVLESLCWGVAILSTSLLLLKLVVGTLLDGLDGHLDGHLAGSVGLLGGGDGETLPGGGLKAVLAGLGVAGWSGVLCFQLTRFSPLVVLGMALGSGAVTFLLTVWLLRQLYRIESDGTLQPTSAIGQFGTVYLTIPAHGQGCGQIQIETQGRLATLDAMTDGQAIPTGSRVFVHSVSNGVLMVAPESLLSPYAGLEAVCRSNEAKTDDRTLATPHKEVSHG